MRSLRQRACTGELRSLMALHVYEHNIKQMPEVLTDYKCAPQRCCVRHLLAPVLYVTCEDVCSTEHVRVCRVCATQQRSITGRKSSHPSKSCAFNQAASLDSQALNIIATSAPGPFCVCGYRQAKL